MVGFGPPASRQTRREWWRRQIQRQKEDSLSVAEFCRRLGVSSVTFWLMSVTVTCCSLIAVAMRCDSRFVFNLEHQKMRSRAFRAVL